MYDRGVLECAITLPGEGVVPDVTQTSVSLGIGGKGEVQW